MRDVLIIGGGPAGLTAALYAARAGKSVTVCEKEALGGQITQAHEVQNYPAIASVSGLELGDRLCAQAMDAGAEIEFTAVTALSRREDGSFSAETEDGTIDARSVIFAGGAKPRPLGLHGEADLIGAGVSYCALCDGDFFRKQDVAVVGGGSTAASDALFLAAICRSVTLIHRRDTFRAEDAVMRAVRSTENIRILTPCRVTALHGDDCLTAISVHHADTDETEELPVSALFIALGRVPDCSLIAPLTALDTDGCAAAAEDCRGGTPGLFIAGDCRAKAIRQLTTAVADGTVAATGACHYLDAL